MITIKMKFRLFITVIFGLRLSNGEECPGVSGGCCSGYYRNVNTNTCTECNDGFYGQNCSRKCRAGWYGRRCLYECNCEQNRRCDHIKGCLYNANPISVENIVTENVQATEESTFQTSKETNPETTDSSHQYTSSTIDNPAPSRTLVALIGAGISGWILIFTVSVILLCNRFKRRQTNANQQRPSNTDSKPVNEELTEPLEADYDEIEDSVMGNSMQSRQTSYLSVVNSEEYYTTTNSDKQTSNEFVEQIDNRKNYHNVGISESHSALSTSEESHTARSPIYQDLHVSRHIYTTLASLNNETK